MTVTTLPSMAEFKAPPFRVYNERTWDKIPHLQKLSPDLRESMRIVAKVLPFRVNEFVLDNLIDWDRAADDPMFRLLFPQPEMLEPEDFARIRDLVRADADKKALAAAINDVRMKLNPHPAGQMELNVPRDDDGNVIDGLQHKYDETVLFFPSQGQTCHSYCSFCFRWPQFVGIKDLRFASSEAAKLHGYLRANPQVTDLLMTGGDPMVAKTRHLAAYLEPLLEPEFAHIQNIRIGTKSLTYWPFRYLTDEDADDLLLLFERLTAAGKHVAIMAHYNHWRELDNVAVEAAIARIRATGANIRAQGPLLGHINDSADVWARMWKRQVQLGIIPYYMFVERDTGAKRYFEVPLARAYEIYRDAIQQVSGLARTVRGPSMSAGPGKVEIQGVSEVAGEKVFVLRLLQGRKSEWTNRPFFAAYDDRAGWLNQLKPAFGENAFFFEDEYRKMCHSAGVESKLPL